ncbi:MAG: 4-hydroxybutyrate CoA-transferase [Syntrophomonadaceae bacterium]|nr:4-hydroxybutyrate CoA-transferase [Syntrophomonadaceae bacterium]
MDWKEEYKKKLTTAEEVAKAFKSGDVISMCGGCNVPHAIAAAIAKRAGEITDVTFCQALVLQTPEYMKPEYREHFRVESVFLGAAERTHPEWIDPVPKHLGSMYQWLLDVEVNKAAVMVSPPDENGYMVRSLYGGLLPSKVIDRCEYLAVEVNRHMPWIYSDNNSFALHVSEVDAIVENDLVLPQVPDIAVTPVEEQMAAIIADMIPDGSTIQLGLGGLANCIGYFLKEKKDLGIYTEVLSNSMMELVKCGAVNNSKKTVHRDKVIYTFGVGTHELFDYLDRNPYFLACEIENTNDPAMIARNENIVSVNNALMVDLTGQAASESIGPRQYSATGGQVNFVLGSQLAKNGKSIIALPSTRTDKEGKLHSRILDVFPPATAVTTSRNDIEWVVTEYGAVRLTSMSISKRAKALISIAHPDFRDELMYKARQFQWL